MFNKLIVKIIITAVVAGGAGFYGGYTYGHSQTPPNNNTGANGGQRQFQAGQFPGRNGNGGTRFGGANGSFLNGEIISKNDQGLTIKLGDNSTRIILVPPSVQVTQAAQGTINDLKEGDSVTVTGTSNSDGSFSANSINIRPTPPPQTPPASSTN